MFPLLACKQWAFNPHRLLLHLRLLLQVDKWIINKGTEEAIVVAQICTNFAAFGLRMENVTITYIS